MPSRRDRTLDILCAVEPANGRATMIRCITGIHYRSLYSLLESLVEKGLLFRYKNPEGFGFRYGLTDLGRRLLRDLRS